MPAPPKTVASQRDFSAGEIDPEMSRSEDDPLYKTGCRQAANYRILNSKKLSVRPGRRVVYLPDGTRVERVLIKPGTKYDISFGNGTVSVYDSTGTRVFTQSGFPWTTATLKNIVWDIYSYDIYICFTAMKPQVLSWDGTSTWSIAAYAEKTYGNQKRTPFYRLSPKDITLMPGAKTGAGVSLTFSAGMNLTASHVGTRIRYGEGSQILITAVTSAVLATGTIQQDLPVSQSAGLTVASTTGYFAVGDLIVGSITGARGIVISWNNATLALVWQLLSTSVSFNSTTDTLIGPNGSGGVDASGIANGAPQAISIWDDEVMNSFRGWPQSVAVDQNRLIFSNFQSLPAGIAWSAVGQLTDLYPGATPDEAIFELAPGKSQVLYVVSGTESSEFVFCDNAIYYIPITPTNPLKPGSVAFQTISANGAQQVQPRKVKEQVVYIGAGDSTTVMALVAVGSYTRPYEAKSISENHSHLFNNPIAICAPTADSTFPEDYVYVLNSDGTLACGKYDIDNGQVKATGWVPWSGSGTVSWAATLAADALFTTSYAPGSASADVVLEIVDNTYYADAALLVNNLPTAMAAPPGKGPLWWIPNGTVDLYDIALTGRPRPMGNYVIDADGNIVPQFHGGEDLTSLTLVAGQMWTATFEPFAPNVGPGQDVGQRMQKRCVSNFVITVQNCAGFDMQRLFSGPITPTSPAIGTVMGRKTIPTWQMSEDVTVAPPLRSQSYSWSPLGYYDDPRVAISKNILGPQTITESLLETTV